MKNLSIAFLAAVSLVSFAGCKGKKGGDMMAKMTEYKEQMCKCTDKACADKVVAEMAKAQEGDKEAKAPDPEEAKKYAPIMKEYTDCMMKAMGAGGMGAPAGGGEKPAAPAGEKPAEQPPAAAPPTGEKAPEPPAAPPAPPAGEKPAGAN